MAGWIAVTRNLWKHDFFKDSQMSEREAWMWMLGQAAWADTTHRVGGDVLDVPRGSFMTTLRDLQSVFMWGSDTRVRNFLKRLESERMARCEIVGRKNAPKTHVTICNYNEYQSSERAAERTEKRTENAPTNAVKKQLNNLTIDDDVSAGSEISFREKVLIAAGHDASGLTATGKIVGGSADWAGFSQACGDLGILPEDALQVVAETANQKRDGPPNSLKYFIPSLQKFAGAKSGAKVVPITGQHRQQPAKVSYDLSNFKE